MRKRYYGLVVVLFSLLIIVSIFYFRFGFLQIGNIDKRDLIFWNYSDGVINGAEERFYFGEDTTCWLMLHGYTSTPLDIAFIGEEINKEFNEVVIIPRLLGHGELPSKINELSFDDWYLQISEEYLQLEESCEKINVLGFSFGGALAMKLAQEKNVTNLYLINPLLKLNYRTINVIPKEMFISFFADILIYKKRNVLDEFGFVEGRISYLNMPLKPMKYSFDELKIIRLNLNKIDSPILIHQSLLDRTVSPGGSFYILNNVNSSKKEIVTYLTAGHFITQDDDIQKLLNSIVSFERGTR